MDPSSRALRKVRDEVTESRAWSKLQRELLTQIRHVEYQAGDAQLRTFNSLSTHEKLAAVDRAVKAVGGTPEHTKLQTKIAAAVDHHFSSLVYHPSQSTQQAPSSGSVAIPSRARHGQFERSQVSPSSTCPLAEACSRLLQDSPHLKHSLKVALNHPLPSPLRLSAWKLLLHYPTVQKDFLVTGQKMQPRNGAEREIPQRCQSILSSNVEVFRDLADSSTALLAMKAVMLYWKQRTNGHLLDSEFMLCLPFIYVWRQELKGDMWPIFSEIAGAYVRFMEMLPPSIGSADSGDHTDGMSKFSQRVEELLQAEDIPLYKALLKLFTKASTGYSQSPRRKNQDGSSTESFHECLKTSLHSHIQKMLVGDLSMEVLCYIWDQCFMGLDVPEYQCLPYFTTVWLILLRDRLLKATSVEAMEEVLSVHSQSLTITQFQQEMERRFLPHLSSLLKVKPLPFRPTQPHPLPPLQPHSSLASHPSHRPSSHPPHLPHSHPLHNPSREGRGRGQSTPHTPFSGDNTEMDFRQRLEEMQQKVEREQQLLSHRMKEEREQHHKQLEVFRRELGEMKTRLAGVTQRRLSAAAEQSLRSLAPTHSSPSKQPTLLLVDSSSGQSDRVRGKKSVQVIPATCTFSSQQTVSDASGRPFSPSNLSERDVQTLWLKVLHKFTTAAYTLCHGTGSERQELFSSLHSSTPTET